MRREGQVAYVHAVDLAGSGVRSERALITAGIEHDHAIRREISPRQTRDPDKHLLFQGQLTVGFDRVKSEAVAEEVSGTVIVGDQIVRAGSGRRDNAEHADSGHYRDPAE